MSPTSPAISVQGLKKSYGPVEAVKGIDFEIQPGEVFGLLGPNGAGKTTTVEILEGLRARSGGQVAVLGFDPDKQRQRLKDRIGVCLQATNLPGKIRVHEAMDVFASFYTRNVNLDQLLKRLQLEEKRNAYYETLSGGQKQRLALALALVNDPQLIFLDEPTTGLDPQVRAEIHTLLEELKREQRTILLTTHYIEEAERLCDRVAIVDEGRIIALDSPSQLQQQSRNASSIVVTCATPFPRARPAWAEATESVLDSTGHTLTVRSRRPAATLVDLVKWIDQQGLELTDVRLKQPSLEDVFIEMTGKESAPMKSYKALIAIDLKLALRNRSVIFFNYLFPLIFFFIFGQAMHAERGAAITMVIAMVLIIGILGNGLMGAGIRAVQEREANILRRYKVTPITPAPLLAASVVTGWILYMPNVILILALAHFLYGMPWPQSMVSILIFISVAIAGFRAIGLILASVVNSMQESQLIVQLIYLPMLFLSGATFPLSMFPPWLLVITQFVPASYMVTGIQGMLLRQEGLWANREPLLALVLTAGVGLFIGYKLFRWEKEEKIRASAKLSLLAVLAPFLLLGAWQMHTRSSIAKTRVLHRELARGDTYLIRGARIFVGNGKVIENGTVLVRSGKIAEVYDGAGPDPKSVNAEVVEAVGKTILPGLIDVHVHLGAPGGFYPDMSKYDAQKSMLRELSAYLYSGVTTVRSVGDGLDIVLKVRSTVNGGEALGAELSTCGPLFTAEGGHGTEYFNGLPENLRANAEKQFTRIPTSAENAQQQVDELKRRGVDCIKAILEAGAGGRVFNRLDTGLFDAVARAAHADDLPLAVHTGDARDVADAVRAQANSIEHGSFRETIPDALFETMARQGTFYDPTLSVGEAFRDFAAGNAKLLKRSLVQQVGPPELLQGTEEALGSNDSEPMRAALERYPIDMKVAIDNLKRAQQHGVSLVTGSDAGNFLVIHGPTVQHELELWVQAGIPPAVALQAATFNAARLLRAEKRIGSIQPGNDADLLVVDGNPLDDISATERISLVVFKGERVDRTELFNQR